MTQSTDEPQDEPRDEPRAPEPPAPPPIVPLDITDEEWIAASQSCCGRQEECECECGCE
jgi:hypothetical protein